MAMLDDMDKKISGWFNAGAGKAKDMSESLRISGSIREEENKQAELYKQIGQFYFENYGEQAEGQVKEWCSNIAASKAQVMQYKEQLRILKGTVACPNCGAEVSSNSAFCNVCGTKIEVSRRQSKGKVCPNCGAAADAGSTFCTTCGTKLPDDVPAYTPPVQELRCPGCNAIVEEGQTFCTKCGTRIQSPAESVQQVETVEDELVEPVQPVAEFPQVEEVPAPEEIEIPRKKICPQCGVELEPEQIFCTNCGTKVGQ